jgi:hypothetical protein
MNITLVARRVKQLTGMCTTKLVVTLSGNPTTPSKGDGYNCILIEIAEIVINHQTELNGTTIRSYHRSGP